MHISLTILAVLSTISAQSTALTTPLKAPYSVCIPLRVFDLRLGRVQNCAAAILALPIAAEPVTFHTGGHNDIGSLPVTKTSGDCMVTVDLLEVSEMSTWTSIKLVASLLMTACTDTSLNVAYTGGYASAGNGGKIKISLQRFEGRIEGVGNASSLVRG